MAFLAGALLNNPWTIVPILGATFWIGFQVTGSPQAGPVDWDVNSLTALYHQAAPYAVPFAVGGLVLSIAGAAVSYPVAYYVITQYRGRRRTTAEAERRLPPGTGLS